jgi:DNA mismatch endonuclease (patch repair protein)
MARIRGKNTAPERLLRSALHREGIRFRLHCRDLPGSPDLVLPRHSAVILVHGCFWHRHAGCPDAATPKTRVEFWSRKLSDNTKRDQRQVQSLLTMNWRVLIVWECALRRPAVRKAAVEAAMDWIHSGAASAEIPPAQGG